MVRIEDGTEFTGKVELALAEVLRNPRETRQVAAQEGIVDGRVIHQVHFVRRQGADAGLGLETAHLLVMIGVIGHPVAEAEVQGGQTAVPVEDTVDAGLRIGQVALHLIPGLDHRRDAVLGRAQGEIVVPPEIGLVGGIDTHPVLLLLDRRKDEVQLGMEGKAGAGAEIELLRRGRLGRGLELHVVGRELIGALIGLLEHGIVEIQVEPGHGIRHRHLLRRLGDGGGAALVGVRDLHGRIEVLSIGQGGHRRRKGRREDMLSHVRATC